MAASDGSIPPTLGSVPHQASGNSSPCSHSSSGGSRHPVSALKKWLTNPVRKLSSDARAGAGKVEKQMCRSDGKQPPSLLSHSEIQPRPLEQHDNHTILPSADTVRLEARLRLCPLMFNNTLIVTVCNGCCVCAVQVWKDGPLSPAAPAPTQPPCQSQLCDLLQGRDTQSLVMFQFYSIQFYSVLFYSGLV